jgi:hypothetical protein
VYTVMDRLIGHWDWNDYFSPSPIFPFRNTHLLEVKYQFRARTRQVFT